MGFKNRGLIPQFQRTKNVIKFYEITWKGAERTMEKSTNVHIKNAQKGSPSTGNGSKSKTIPNNSLNKPKALAAQPGNQASSSSCAIVGDLREALKETGIEEAP